METTIEFTKEEYAEIHWDGVKQFIAKLEDSKWSDRDKLFQLIGYMQSYAEQDEQLKFNYETC